MDHFIHNNQTYKIIEANENNADMVKMLCDETLGNNFYSKNDLIELFNNERSWFWLLYTEDNEFIGFHYHYIDNLKNISHHFKTDYNDMLLIPGISDTNAGVLKSVAIDKKYRGKGIAFVFSNYAIDNLFENNAKSIWVPAWKQDTYVPENNTLLKQGFTHYCDVNKLWYDNKNLRCPICCQEHCICNAAIYFRIRSKCNEKEKFEVVL